METSGGSPTQIWAPDRDKPFNKERRESRNRLVITCDMNGASLRREFPRQNQRSNEFLKLKLRAAEIRRHFGDQRAIARSFQASRNIAEVLLHHALLTLRSPRQYQTQLARRREL